MSDNFLNGPLLRGWPTRELLCRQAIDQRSKLLWCCRLKSKKVGASLIAEDLRFV
jgi:hypothetical protein